MAPAPIIKIAERGNGAADAPMTRADAVARMEEAEDTLRAIAAGEVDAFVVSDGRNARRTFTLSTADRPYRMFVENMRDGAATLSADGIVLYANRRLAQLLSCGRDAVVGASLYRFLADGPAVDLSELRGPDGFGATFELDLLDGNATTVPVLVGSSPLDVDGTQLMCLTFTDLSAQRTQEREIARLGRAQDERLADLQDAQAALTRQATHDALTDLPNRALLVDRIDQALLQAGRSGRSTAVLFVDLDRFKQVNDTHGHAAGDRVLRRVAEGLVMTLRPTDTVARIGGDEFVVLAPEVDSELHAVDIADRLLSELSRPSSVPGRPELVNASVGISVSVGGRGTAEVLLKEADAAMYQAKALGGAQAEVFDVALGRQAHDRAIAQNRLQTALDEHRVFAHYQPVIDLHTGGIAGFEALARIADHDGAVLPPSEFIPVAENTGLVVPLGAQVLEMACREAVLWPPVERPGQQLTVAVNISSRQFESGDLTSMVRNGLVESGLPPDRLHLELTETAIMDLEADLLRQLGEIRDLGVQIGLDDFGTGYASLTHLRRLPLTFVKIDQTFVQGLGADEEDERIVSAVIDLAANLGLRSIAEGVETTEQHDRVRQLGCDQAQGYLYSRPVPANEVGATVDQAARRL